MKKIVAFLLGVTCTLNGNLSNFPEEHPLWCPQMQIMYNNQAPLGDMYTAFKKDPQREWIYYRNDRSESLRVNKKCGLALLDLVQGKTYQGVGHLLGAQREGSWYAKYYMGFIYLVGHKRRPNPEKALVWFRQAEEHHNPCMLSDWYNHIMIAAGARPNIPYEFKDNVVFRVDATLCEGGVPLRKLARSCAYIARLHGDQIAAELWDKESLGHDQSNEN